MTNEAEYAKFDWSLTAESGEQILPPTPQKSGPSKIEFNARHLPLIKTLTILYTLLADLRFYPHTNILIPPSEGWSASRFDVADAQEYGFPEETINFVAQLPYLQNPEFFIDYEISPKKYLDDGDWGECHDPTYNPDNAPLPGHAVVLTESHWGQTRRILIYDIQNACLKAWDPFNDLFDDPWTSMPSWSLEDGQNPLAELILSFMSIERYILDPRQLFITTISYCFRDKVTGKPLPDYHSDGYWTDKYDRTLGNVYEACGWDIEPGDQLRKELSKLEGNETNDDAQSLPDKLEEARKRASRNFNGEQFDQKKQEWMDYRYKYLRQREAEEISDIWHDHDEL